MTSAKHSDPSGITTLPLSKSAWTFRNAKESKFYPATVPGCVHTDLRTAGLIPDPFWGSNELDLRWIENEDWVYETVFQVDLEQLQGERVELVADGLDTIATVSVNGQEVAKTNNMFIGYRWDVKSLLKDGCNTISIHFASSAVYARETRTDYEGGVLNDPESRAPVIRKEQCQFGWDWGPRFVTAGIWQDIRIESAPANVLRSFKVEQEHRENGEVLLSVSPEVDGRLRSLDYSLEVSLNGVSAGTVASLGNGRFEVLIENPELWWPNGLGSQPLYEICLSATSKQTGTPAGSCQKTIGLRTIKLVREADEAGESFYFSVNGKPVFAKGANWIPVHAFVAGLTRDDYARDLESAAAANMNMIRVWGGGIYETEDFYDLCDELGLLVWQDFMFACAHYPGDAAFVRSVKEEATQQVKRLHHRASLALWCGNNESELLAAKALTVPKNLKDYKRVFEKLLPEVVSKNDGQTDYWQSSPHRPDGENGHEAGEKHGDTHFWDVWHARHPVKSYEKWNFRFCSEFGMQSYSSPATNATFCSAEDNNVFGPAMENHQKNCGGNQVILDYVSRRYRFPKSQDDLIYLSQLNQAYCMQVGVEHYRRLMPHCMGALYWQLNDCWPVASWSSIEFTGRWKALHFIAKRFFSPALVTAKVDGDESWGIGNYRHSDIEQLELYTVFDGVPNAKGLLSWELFHVNGESLLQGTKRVNLRYGESKSQKTLKLAKLLKKHGRDNLFMRIALDSDDQRLSEDTVFFTPIRFVELPKAETKVAIRKLSKTEFELDFTSTAFQHRFEFDFPGLCCKASDNYFELYAGETKTVQIEFPEPVALGQLKRGIKYRSLVNTY
ncbi:beta-mannosidase [Pelagicoccus albus]|nr:glycoside hydrolase family 2 protein [Pelagicoccus albus]